MSALPDPTPPAVPSPEMWHHLLTSWTLPAFAMLVASWVLGAIAVRFRARHQQGIGETSG